MITSFLCTLSDAYTLFSNCSIPWVLFWVSFSLRELSWRNTGSGYQGLPPVSATESSGIILAAYKVSPSGIETLSGFPGGEEWFQVHSRKTFKHAVSQMCNERRLRSRLWLILNVSRSTPPQLNLFLFPGEALQVSVFCMSQSGVRIFCSKVEGRSNAARCASRHGLSNFSSVAGKFKLMAFRFEAAMSW